MRVAHTQYHSKGKRRYNKANKAKGRRVSETSLIVASVLRCPTELE